MPNINAVRPVIHEMIFKGFCYINLYKNLSLNGVAIFTPGTLVNKLQSPGPRDDPY